MKYAIVYLSLAILSLYAAFDFQLDKNRELTAQAGVMRTAISGQYLTINKLEDYRESLKPLEIPPYGWPVHSDDYKEITSPYGLRDIPAGIYTGGALTRTHIGIDLSGLWKARITAIDDGEVIDNFYPPDGYWKGHPIYGGMIRILHSDGRISIYAHLSVVYINETDKRFIKKGQVIGRMGNTGLSDGNHLHFELWENNISIQPLKYMDKP